MALELKSRASFCVFFFFLICAGIKCMFWSGIGPYRKIIYIVNKINLKQSGTG